MKTVILAGGKGTRLWPMSRSYFPKQFIKFTKLNGKSLFQTTFLRALEISTIDDVMVLVTDEKQKSIVVKEINELNINFRDKNILIVPDKDTFVAISYAIQFCDDDALFLPSDHVIGDETKLIDSLEEAKNLSKESLVIFGIKPKSAHTGYGYIKYSGNVVLEFKEKPDKDTAQDYVDEGYLWNSGMFYFNKKVFNDELNKVNPDFFKFLSKASISEIFKDSPKISIDYGLLEKSSNIKVIPLDIEWIDLGNFDSLSVINEKDENLNQASSNTVFYNSTNNLVNVKKQKVTALIDVDDLIVVDTEEALLICRKDSSEKIKKVHQMILDRNDNNDKSLNDFL